MTLPLEQALRAALAANDLTLYSASGAHVFNGETAIRDLADGIAARLTRTGSQAEVWAVLEEAVMAPGARQRLAEDGVIYGELPVNPPCPCGCNGHNLGPCPIPSRGIPSRWCYREPRCKCIALVSQAACEGCYVAMK